MWHVNEHAAHEQHVSRRDVMIGHSQPPRESLARAHCSGSDRGADEFAALVQIPRRENEADDGAPVVGLAVDLAFKVAVVDTGLYMTAWNFNEELRLQRCRVVAL